MKDLPFIENEWVIKDSKLSSWHSQDFACLRLILKFTHSFLFHRCIGMLLSLPHATLFMPVSSTQAAVAVHQGGSEPWSSNCVRSVARTLMRGAISVVKWM